MFRRKQKPMELDYITEDGVAIYDAPDYEREIALWQEEINGELYIITGASRFSISRILNEINKERNKLYDKLRQTYPSTNI